MKRSIALIIALSLALTLSACSLGAPEATPAQTPDVTPEPSPTQSPAGAPDEEAQLRLIADSVEVWRGDMDGAGSGYAVTDLDGNGRLEIIASSCQGTGLYTYSLLWEVNEAGDGLVSLDTGYEEGESQADIMVPSVPAYSDGEGGLHYIFTDYIRVGAAERHEVLYAVALEEGRLVNTPLAYRSELYSPDAPEEPQITVTGADGGAMTQEEYLFAADTAFAGQEKLTASIGWIAGDEASALIEGGAEARLEALLASWSGFGVEK